MLCLILVCSVSSSNSRQGTNHPDCELDTESADDRRGRRLKLSKWFQGTFNTIQHPIFWYLLYICRCMRGPLRHFFAFVQQQAANNNEGEVVRKLVTGKLDEFLQECRTLYARMTDIIQRAMQLSGCTGLFKDDANGRASLALIARKVCYQQWASFQRRICYPMQQRL